jgi:hypothetical protein
MSEADTKATKAAPPREPGRYPLLSTWIAYGTSLVAFMAAGQTLTSRAGEMYDALNLELPKITQFQVEQPRLAAAGFVAVGLVLLAATRVRTRSLVSSIVFHGLALLAALTGAVFLYASVLVFEKLQTALGM